MLPKIAAPSSNNTATEYEGGGIVIYGGEGEISKGSIKGNKTETKSDLGGGGIYVNTALFNIDAAAVFGGVVLDLGAAAHIERAALANVDAAAVFPKGAVSLRGDVMAGDNGPSMAASSR